MYMIGSRIVRTRSSIRSVHYLPLIERNIHALDQAAARQYAAEGRDHAQFLARLVELELIGRERRMIERRIMAAKFPATKSLDSFDFKAIPDRRVAQQADIPCQYP